MTNFAYTLNIPAATNNPSADQPNLLTNTNNIGALIGVDHITFGIDNGGCHIKSTYQGNLFTLLSPPPTIPGQIAVYNNVTTGGSTLAYVRDGQATGIQLTDFHAPGAVSGVVGGGTFVSTNSFLPGGFIIQSGHVTAPSSSNPVIFPVTFPVGVVSIILNVLFTGDSLAHYASVTSFSSSQFTFKTDVSFSGSPLNYLFWTAIGT